MHRKELTEQLLELVKLDGPSRGERPVADYIIKDLGNIGFRIEEDETGKSVNGNCGNLLCYPPNYDPERPCLLLVAHLDTVQSTAVAAPVINGDRLTSANEYAVGVDNRAGVTLLLNGARHLVKNDHPKTNVLFVFTVCEEIGAYGAQHINLPDNIEFGFVVDSSARPGKFIRSTYGAYRFTLNITGRRSHAGLEPEKGINAIYLASRVIAQLPVGRISPDLTCNIAMISGGKAINVVPDEVEVKGEIRGSDVNQIHKQLQQIEQVTGEVCTQYCGNFSFNSSPLFLPYSIDEQADIYCFVEKIFISLGLVPQPLHYSGGSDANVFNARGVATINIGIGAQQPHGSDEFILLDDLVRGFQIVTKIIDEYRAGS